MSSVQIIARLKRRGQSYIGHTDHPIITDSRLASELMSYLSTYGSLTSGWVELEGKLFHSEAIYVDGDLGDDLASAYVVVASEAPDSPGKSMEPDLAPVVRAIRDSVLPHVLESETVTPDSKISIFSDFVEPTFTYQTQSSHGVRQLISWHSLKGLARVVVTGGPGTGKTTAMQRLAFEWLNTDDTSGPVPFYLRLRDLSEDELSLDFILGSATDAFDSDGLERSLMQSRGIVVILDGLDEVPVVRQGHLVQGIRSLSRSNPALRLFVTCRAESYKSFFPDYHHVEIEPLSKAAVAHWTRLYFGERHQPELPQQFLSYMARSSSMAELCRVPLLLNRAAWLFSRDGVPPTRRSEVLSRWVSTVLYEWDESRGVRRFARGELDQSHMRVMLHQLALRAADSPEVPFDAGALTVWRLADDLPSAEEVLERLARYCGLLEHSNERWRFRHFVFVEHLAAEAIVGSGPSGYRLLSQRLADVSWRGVWDSACGIASEMSELLEMMLNATEIPDWIRLRHILLALNQAGSCSDAVLSRVSKWAETTLHSHISADHTGHELRAAPKDSVVLAVHSERGESQPSLAVVLTPVGVSAVVVHNVLLMMAELLLSATGRDFLNVLSAGDLPWLALFSRALTEGAFVKGTSIDDLIIDIVRVAPSTLGGIDS